MALVHSSSSIIATVLDSLRAAATTDRHYSKLLKTPLAHMHVREGLLFSDTLVIVPADTALRSLLISEHHDTPYAGHLGVTKTLGLLRRQFTWRGMGQDVHRYVTSCPQCQLGKHSRLPPAGLAQPLGVPDRPFQSVSLDFVGPLPLSQGFNSLMVVVCMLTKKLTLVPTTIDLTAPACADLLLHEVFRHKGIPDRLVSDRDPLFNSIFWRELFKLYGTKLNMSTAHHPQTDGQSEVGVKTVIEMLRCFVNLNQDNWPRLIDLMEIAYNNSIQASTGHTPFYLDLGYHPRLPSTLPTASPLRSASAEERRALWEATLLDAQLSLEHAQALQSRYSNKSRRHLEFAPGDTVRLSTAHLLLRASPSRKLAPKYVKLRVLERLGPSTYRLELPSGSRAHDVFNVRLLEPYREDPSFGRPPGPSPTAFDTATTVDTYEVEAIVDSRKVGRRTQYLVKWLGYSEADNTWEDAQDCAGARVLVREYLARAHDGVHE